MGKIYENLCFRKIDKSDLTLRNSNEMNDTLFFLLCKENEKPKTILK